MRANDLQVPCERVVRAGRVLRAVLLHDSSDMIVDHEQKNERRQGKMRPGTSGAVRNCREALVSRLTCTRVSSSSQRLSLRLNTLVTWSRSWAQDPGDKVVDLVSSLLFTKILGSRSCLQDLGLGLKPHQSLDIIFKRSWAQHVVTPRSWSWSWSQDYVRKVSTTSVGDSDERKRSSGEVDRHPVRRIT